MYDKLTGTQTGASNTAAVSKHNGVLVNSGNVIVDGGLSSWSGIGQFATNQALQNVTSTALNKALGQGGSFDDALTSTLANTFAAAGFNWVGDFSQQKHIANGSLTKIGLHAIMGGLAAEAAGGDFKSGALVAGANEALIDSLAKQYGEMDADQRAGLLTMNSQVLGVLVASMAGGDEKDMQTGAWVAGNATSYNRQLHPDEIEFASDRERVQRYADEYGLSEDAARKELLRTAAAWVDRGWNEALTEADGKTERAVAFLESEMAGHGVKMFQATQLEYNNERLGLIELFESKKALEVMFSDVALIDPRAYRSDPQYQQEILHAKGLGSQEGFGNAIENLIFAPLKTAFENPLPAPSKTGLWLMTAANCPECTLDDVQTNWNALLSLPEDFRYKGRLDQLHIMQGKGFEVVKGNAASSTELGIEIGLSVAPVLSGKGVSGKALAGESVGVGVLKSTEEVIVQYGPMRKGPLDKETVKTFRSGAYREIITTEPTTLYRVINESGTPGGAYWTRTKPAGPVQSIIDSALDQQWKNKNTAVRVVEMQVPVGTRMFEGVAAPQRGLVGGGSQIYFDKNINPLNEVWIKQ